MTTLKQTLQSILTEHLNRVEGVVDSKRIEEIERELVEEYEEKIKSLLQFCECEKD